MFLQKIVMFWQKKFPSHEREVNLVNLLLQVSRTTHRVETVHPYSGRTGRTTPSRHGCTFIMRPIGQCDHGTSLLEMITKASTRKMQSI